MLRMIKQLIYLLVIAVVAASFFLGYKFNQFQSQPINLQQESITFTILPGNTLRQVAQKLADKG